MVKACCILMNPFDPDCRGCKWPDGQNGKSLPIQIRYRGFTTLNLGNSTNQNMLHFHAGLPNNTMLFTYPGGVPTAAASY